MTKFGVVIFPGSNCDQDMICVLQDIMGQKVEKLWHKEADLKGCDFIVLPGGFSYGDYLRSGAIARFSPIMDQVIQHTNKGGYVLGICNGFQVLCESGLLPGALLHNNNQKFICSNIHLKTITTDSKITAQLNPVQPLKIPIAHGEGRYFCDEESLTSLKKGDQILFKYCDENGTISDDTNPNGSIDNIAGVCNDNKNVFGMMPHPERAADTSLGNCDGKLLFESILELVS